MPFSVSIVWCYLGESGDPQLLGLAETMDGISSIVQEFVASETARLNDQIAVFSEPGGIDPECDAEAVRQMTEFRDRLARLPIRRRRITHCDHFRVEEVTLRV